MKKAYIFDTNVVLYDSNSIFSFDNSYVIIPMTVIEECDRFKRDSSEIGHHARQFSKNLDNLRHKGKLVEGIELENGSILKIAIYHQEFLQKMPPELRIDRGDNRILAVAIDYQGRFPDTEVCFVTKDSNLRIKADTMGLAVQDYENIAIDVGTEFVGPGSGGYIVIDLPTEKRSLFYDLLKGFEDYSKLKGYDVYFSIDSTFKDKVAFKFTVNDDNFDIDQNTVREDFQEYIRKVNNGESLDDIPISTSYEQHYTLLTALKNRISLIEHQHNLTKNAMDFYKNLFSSIPNSPIVPTNVITLNTGHKSNSHNYSAVNSSNIIQGQHNELEDNSIKTNLIIGSTFSSKKGQIDKIDILIEFLKKEVAANASYESVIKNLEKVKEEIEDEPQPDASRISKWLEKSKQVLDVGNLAHETVDAAKKLFSAFGLGL